MTWEELMSLFRVKTEKSSILAAQGGRGDSFLFSLLILLSRQLIG